MSRRNVLYSAALAIGLVAVLMWWVGSTTLRGRAPVSSSDASPKPAAPTSAPPMPHGAPATPTAPAADAAVRRYLAREEFQRRTREFFDHADGLDPRTRDREAKAIETVLDGYERAGELSAGEAVLLRTALIRATVSDEAERIDRIAELATRYRLDAERRMADYAAHPDPRLEEYKKRERLIVDEVMAMSAIPDGLSRDEYLRLRLQHEREAVYADLH